MRSLLVAMRIHWLRSRGAIAEAMHGIPDALKRQAEDRYLGEALDMLEVLQEVYDFYENCDESSSQPRYRSALPDRP